MFSDLRDCCCCCDWADGYYLGEGKPLSAEELQQIEVAVDGLISAARKTMEDAVLRACEAA